MCGILQPRMISEHEQESTIYSKSQLADANNLLENKHDASTWIHWMWYKGCPYISRNHFDISKIAKVVSKKKIISP